MIPIRAISGRVIGHSCDNRKCVNPEHLFLATQAENIADMVAKNRQAKGGRVHGSKLTAEDVRAIRRDHVHVPGDLRILADKYRVTKQAIHAIIKGKHWGWLE